ncbi:ATPase, AAA-type, core [Corchorus capsularis]|uniref:ATPase, AAA-type, core n=1 Tax=Corchorus capsularis TaxID=210143 RepID=A0A1R3GFW0_COCAP|nr:ATPase, AAA-type, core [Corchorus capsularis]
MAMLIRTILNEIIPKPLQKYISSKFSDIVSTYFSSTFTFIIEERWQAVFNETFRAVEVYLPTRIGPSTDKLVLGSNDPNNPLAPPKRNIPSDCKIIDEFEGMTLEWTLRVKESEKYYVPDKKCFHLTCKKGVREKVEQRYFPHIAKTAQTILRKREKLFIYTYNQDRSRWESALFKHPARFETLAMEPEVKQSIIDDLDSFVGRKDFFENVGRAWKRGRILTSTTNRSILLIEDIDCSTKVSEDRSKSKDEKQKEGEDGRPINRPSPIDPGVTLSGLLNFIDGLWSSCGNERIIIFTTNHKEKLDPALLRPGRMDVHLHMGYCTPAGFRKLATTYLGIKDGKLFESIDELIKSVEVTPAEVAQQLMVKSDDPEAALQGFIEFLNMKKDKVGEEKLTQEKEAEKKTKKDGGKQSKKLDEAETGSIYLT